jgi:hypothetical protein
LTSASSRFIIPNHAFYHHEIQCGQLKPGEFQEVSVFFPSSAIDPSGKLFVLLDGQEGRREGGDREKETRSFKTRIVT